MEKEQAKREARVLLQSVLSGTTGVLLGARGLCRYIHHLDLANDPRFLVFRGVDSETDTLPLDSDDRSRWSAAALARQDEEIESYSQQVQASILEACHELLVELSEGN